MLESNVTGGRMYKRNYATYRNIDKEKIIKNSIHASSASNIPVSGVLLQKNRLQSD